MTATATKPAEGTRKNFHEVFDLPDNKATRNAHGNPTQCLVLDPPEERLLDFVPGVDKRYKFLAYETKMVLAAFTLNIPLLVWGPHGTGKSTIVEQFCAKTNRPMMRVQHTSGTEESHILGHYVVRSRAVKEGPAGAQVDKIITETVFEPGPLAIAMREGLVYLADEYDFALPSVTAVYQPVLEGKALVIKEAPPEWRVVKPHKNFRFAATGNTNGSGDETGLYQGTQMMNAANYSRFGITIKMDYLPEKQEAEIVASQSGVHPEDAAKLCKIAAEVRKLFGDGKISTTISPRELINAGMLGRMFGKSPNLYLGLELAYGNRLPSTDRKAVMDFVQRIAPPEVEKAA